MLFKVGCYLFQSCYLCISCKGFPSLASCHILSVTAWKSNVVITLEILRNISDLHCARCISAALSQIFDDCDVYTLIFIVRNGIYMSYTPLLHF